MLRQVVDNDHVAPGSEGLVQKSSWVSSIVRFSSQARVVVACTWCRCAVHVARLPSTWQFSKCDSGACYIWSGAEDTGCNQAYTAATSTCRGDNCTVPFGETLSPWGTGSCADVAFHATQVASVRRGPQPARSVHRRRRASGPILALHCTQLLGEEDVYPEHRDASGGWDMSHENSGREFIELRCVITPLLPPMRPP